VFIVVAGVVLASCGSESSVGSLPTSPPTEASAEPTGPPPTTTVVEPVGGSVVELPGSDAAPLGATAVWAVDSAAGVDPAASSFIALVTRLECSGGVTGEVFEPVVEASGSDIVVTFFVAPLDSDLEQSCPENDAVPYEVDLGQPIGTSRLFDGACREGAEASSTRLCAGGAVRWAP